MGNSCGPGRGNSQYNFNYFIQKYGKDQMLTIAKDNVRKEQILKKMPQIIQKYRSSIHDSKIKSIRQLNFTQANIIHEIQTKIKDIQKKDTGEVHKAELHYDKPAEDLMGREQIIKDFTQLRNKISKVYDQQEKKTKQKIQTDFQTYVAQMEKQRKQKITQILQMNEQDRLAVRRQGRKKFKKQIQMYVQQVANQIDQGKIVDMVHLKEEYGHLHPEQQIQALKKKAEKRMEKGESLIKGVNILGVNSKEILPAPVTSIWKCC